jgi:hypothetical protein
MAEEGLSASLLLRKEFRLSAVSYSQARFCVEHLGADFSACEAEHQKYQNAIREASDNISNFGRVHVLDRAFLPHTTSTPALSPSSSHVTNNIQIQSDKQHPHS